MIKPGTERKQLHFVRLFDDFLCDPVIRGLSATAFGMVIYLAASYRGGDPERLSVPYRFFLWSPSAISRGFKELKDKGVIELVEPGGLQGAAGKRAVSVYRFTPDFQRLMRFGQRSVKVAPVKKRQLRIQKR